MILRILLTFTPLFYLACSTTPPLTPGQSQGVITEPLLEQSNANSKSFMEEPLAALTFENGSSATNCREFATQINESPIVESPDNMLAANDYVLCKTLVTFNRAKHNPFHLQANTNLSTRLAKDVDLRSFPSSQNQKTDEQQYTLKSLYGNSLSTPNYKVVQENTEWYFEINIVARLDLDKNGTEDWLVWVIDQAKQGTYNYVGVFAIYNANSQQSLQLRGI